MRYQILATIPSDTRPGIVYEIGLSPLGSIMCSCPGFLYRGYCKHRTIYMTSHCDHPLMPDHAPTPPPRPNVATSTSTLDAAYQCRDEGYEMLRRWRDEYNTHMTAHRRPTTDIYELIARNAKHRRRARR